MPYHHHGKILDNDPESAKKRIAAKI